MHPLNTNALANDFQKSSCEDWMELVQKALHGSDFEKKMSSRTSDDLLLKPLYTHLDTLPHAAKTFPGREPFTRGTKLTREMKGWDIRQYYCGCDASTLNTAILEDLAGGVTSLCLSMGTSNSIAIGKGELAKVLKGVHLDICPVALNAGENTPEAAQEIFDLWDSQNIPESKRLAHFDADPLSHLATMGYLTQPISNALEKSLSLVNRTRNMPGVSVLSADGHVYHCAGASEALELACILATVVSFLRTAEKTGTDPKLVFQKLALTLAVDTNQFLSISKLRAARLLMWRLADTLTLGSEAAHIKIVAISSWRMLTKRDPWTNIIRTTLACASGAMGGADSIIVLPFTYALGDPDSSARRIARNIQIVCQEESHLGRVLDPCGGAWSIESLTDDLANRAWLIFQNIETQGGMEKALESGYVQNEIAKKADLQKKATRTLRSAITGVSAFPQLGPEIIKVIPRREPPSHKVSTPNAVSPLKIERISEPFEVLRDKADDYAKGHGKPYQIFLASLGNVIDHNIRTTWVKNFLAAGGIHSEITEGYKDGLVAAKEFQKTDLKIACLCSSDAIYGEQAETAAKALKSCGAKYVLLAGRPGDQEASLKSAGVDQFLFSGLDAINLLQDLQNKLQNCI